MKYDLAVSSAPSRYFLILIGWLSVALGVLGMFLPVLPTTVFILIAAWCFARSSERFYQWLINHALLGPIVRSWRDNRSIPRDVRNRAIVLMWISMSLSILVVGKFAVAFLLLCIGLMVSVYLLRLPVVGLAHQQGE